jgi:hypothetical protein
MFEKLKDFFNPRESDSKTDERQTDSKQAQPIDRNQIRAATEILQKYKSSKQNLERKIINNEQFWKLRQWEKYSEGNSDDVRPASAWLWNAIISKRADYIDGYPSPNILPRMPDDEEEAQRLTDVIPVILSQNDFKRVYREVITYKLKQGTGVYGVFWDASKHNGLGDIAIKKIDLLKLFWQPGITDIQDSANVFLVDLIDNNVLERTYPQLKGKLRGNDSTVSKYIYDDAIDTSDKSPVIDWYYKKKVGEKTVLHFCKFVGDEVLYATENDENIPTRITTDEFGELTEVPSGESKSVKGFYEHGKYPFVFDTLFSIEGTIAGYGYTDIGKDTQREIDIINQAIVKNAQCGAKPRFFIKSNGAVKESEFADWSKDFVHCDGGLGDDSIRPITTTPLQGNYITFLDSKINELKEVTGNRDVNTGGTSGATAASAIAALQEAGSKQSRDAISGTYDAYKELIYLVIELVREKYSISRYFRIQGESGQAEYIAYNNSGIRPQLQQAIGGVDMGIRTPEFDIEVTAEKSSEYSKLSQNELAIQLYGLGVFNPQNTDQSIMLLDTMDFEGKDDIVQRIREQGTMYDLLMQYQQMALSLAQKYEPQTAAMIAGGVQQSQPGQPAASVSVSSGSDGGETRMQSARDAAQERTQPR